MGDTAAVLAHLDAQVAAISALATAPEGTALAAKAQAILDAAKATTPHRLERLVKAPSEARHGLTTFSRALKQVEVALAGEGSMAEAEQVLDAYARSSGVMKRGGLTPTRTAAVDGGSQKGPSTAPPNGAPAKTARAEGAPSAAAPVSSTGFSTEAVLALVSGAVFVHGGRCSVGALAAWLRREAPDVVAAHNVGAAGTLRALVDAAPTRLAINGRGVVTLAGSAAAATAQVPASSTPTPSDPAALLDAVRRLVAAAPNGVVRAGKEAQRAPRPAKDGQQNAARTVAAPTATATTAAPVSDADLLATLTTLARDLPPRRRRIGALGKELQRELPGASDALAQHGNLKGFVQAHANVFRLERQGPSGLVVSLKGADASTESSNGTAEQAAPGKNQGTQETKANKGTAASDAQEGDAKPKKARRGKKQQNADIVSTAEVSGPAADEAVQILQSVLASHVGGQALLNRLCELSYARKADLKSFFATSCAPKTFIARYPDIFVLSTEEGKPEMVKLVNHSAEDEAAAVLAVETAAAAKEAKRVAQAEARRVAMAQKAAEAVVTTATASNATGLGDNATEPEAVLAGAEAEAEADTGAETAQADDEDVTASSATTGQVAVVDAAPETTEVSGTEAVSGGGEAAVDAEEAGHVEATEESADAETAADVAAAGETA